MREFAVVPVVKPSPFECRAVEYQACGNPECECNDIGEIWSYWIRATRVEEDAWFYFGCEEDALADDMEIEFRGDLLLERFEKLCVFCGAPWHMVAGKHMPFIAAAHDMLRQDWLRAPDFDTKTLSEVVVLKAREMRVANKLVDEFTKAMREMER